MSVNYATRRREILAALDQQLNIFSDPLAPTRMVTVLRAELEALDAWHLLDTYPESTALRSLPVPSGRRAKRDPAVAIIASTVAQMIEAERTRLRKVAQEAQERVNSMRSNDAEAERRAQERSKQPADMSGIQYAPGGRAPTAGELARFRAANGG